MRLKPVATAGRHSARVARSAVRRSAATRRSATAERQRTLGADLKLPRLELGDEGLGAGEKRGAAAYGGAESLAEMAKGRVADFHRRLRHVVAAGEKQFRGRFAARGPTQRDRGGDGSRLLVAEPFQQGVLHHYWMLPRALPQRQGAGGEIQGAEVVETRASA